MTETWPDESSGGTLSAGDAPSRRIDLGAPGDLLLGRFRLGRQLGTGGGGVVYAAQDEHRGETVAIKTLHNLTGPRIERLKSEFRSLAHVVHPNLVELRELFVADERVFFTMELVRGPSFRRWVREGAAPGWMDDRLAGRLRSALHQLLLGVTAIHMAGRVHRDLKPANVLVSNEGRVVVLDFGLAASIADLDPGGDRNTSAGTPEYMAPECGTEAPVGPAADFYSVGVMLYEALTGRVPFHDVRRTDLMAVKRRSDAPDPAAQVPEAPDDLCEICRALLAVDPEARPRAGALLGRLEGLQQAPKPVIRAQVSAGQSQELFLGRNAELAALGEGLHEAGEGRPSASLLHGESGMGKSSLLDAFAYWAESEGALVLASRCFERESMAYKVFDGVVERVAAHLGTLDDAVREALTPDDAAALSTVFPAFHRIARPDARAYAEDGVARRRRALEAFRTLLGGLAAQQRIVVLCDDVQWADRESADVLEVLLRGPNAPGIAWVFSFRSAERGANPELDGLLARVDAAVVPRDVAVGPLAAEDTQALVRATAMRVGGSDVARYDGLAEESGGSPFFLLELVRHAAAGGAAADVTSMVQARWRKMDPPAQRLLAVLAVAQRPLLVNTSLQAAGVLGDGGDRALAGLRVSSLARCRGHGVDERAESYHARVAECVRAALEPDEVRDLHAALASAMEAEQEPDAEALGRHFLGAGQRDRARVHYREAATRAKRQLAFELASELWGRAIELAGGKGQATAADLAEWGECLAAAGHGASAAETFVLAGERTQGRERRAYHRRAAEQLVLCGHLEQGVAILEPLLGEVGLRWPSSPRAAIPRLLWNLLRLKLRGYGYVEQPSAAVKESTLDAIDVVASAALGITGTHPIRAAVLHSEALRWALRCGEPVRVGRALALEATFAAFQGAPVVRFEGLLAQATALAEQTGDDHTVGLVAATRSGAAVLRGEWRMQLQQAEEAEARLQTTAPGWGWARAQVQQHTHASLMFLGRFDALRESVGASIATSKDRNDVFSMALGRIYTTMVALVDDDLDGADREYQLATEHWPYEGFAVPHLAQTTARLGALLYAQDYAAAAAHYQSWAPRVSRSLLARVELIRTGELDHWGRVNIGLGLRGDRAALRVAHKCGGALMRSTDGWGRANGALILGQTEHLLGRPQAQGNFERAIAMYEDLGMVACSASARAAMLRAEQGAGADIGEMLNVANELGVQNPKRFLAMFAPMLA